MRRRRATSRKTVNQVAGLTGDYGSSVCINGVNRELDQYLQTQMRTETSGAAYADVRSTYLANLQTVYGNPGDTGTLEDAFNNFADRAAGPVDQPGLAVGAHRRRQCRADAGAAAQRHDAGHPEPARQCREPASTIPSTPPTTRWRRSRRSTSSCRANGQTDAVDGDAARSARPVHRSAVATDGHPVVTNDLNQVTVFTNSGVQLVGTEAATLSFNAQGTVTPNTLCNPDPAKSNVGTITIKFPHGGSYRPGRRPTSIRSGTDRRLSRAARQDAGAGAGPDRPVRGLDVERAVGQDDGRRRRARLGAAAGGLRSRSRRAAARQRHQRHLHGQHHRHPRTISRSCASTIRRRCRCRQWRRRSIRTTRCSASISPAAWRRSFRNSTPRSAPRANLQFSNPAGSTLARAGRRRAEPFRCHCGFGDDDDDVADQRQSAAAVVHRQRRTPIPARSPRTARSKTGLAGRITVNTALLADPSRTIVYTTNPLTAAGDTTRSDFILSQLTTGSYLTRRRPASAPPERRSPARC